jgi:hypothetical protein
MIKYYGPNPKIIAHIEHICNDKTKVLELGPGLTPFSKATHFCGWDQGTQKVKSLASSISKLYEGKNIKELAARGLQLDAYREGLDACRLHLESL